MAARCATPRTPEPNSQASDREPAPPSAPRPRLKLKRRNVSQPFCAPTSDFLASVAAADVPIPSIEEPEITLSHPADMTGTCDGSDRSFAHDAGLLRLPSEHFAPPRTPAPEDAPLSLSPRRYPDWTASTASSSSAEEEDDEDEGSSSSSSSSPEPDYGSSRPSTSRSECTNNSTFSRLSCISDDQCLLSPGRDAFARGSYDMDEFIPGENAVTSGQPARSSKRHRAPWTREMDAHLWSMLMMYLQDPKVTPFRTGRSFIPPHGVCARVAREAKRSWRGSRVSGSRKAKPSTVAADLKDGSATPTADSTGAFMEWPHTCAATRAHLRELCRLKAAAPAFAGLGRFSRSPTPLTHSAARYWNRRVTPGRSSFATQDIGLSLAVSTSEAMQPYGPLAQLTSSIETPEPTPIEPEHSAPQKNRWAAEAVAEPPRGRLGSPFAPRSYGPSSSFISTALDATDTRQSHTVGPRRTLQSPPRINRTSTARRRSIIGNKLPRDVRHSRKRPSLSTDFWTEPSRAAGGPPQADALPAGRRRGKSFVDAVLARFQPTGAAAAEYSSSSRDELFIPRYSGSLGSSSLQRPGGAGLGTSAMATELSRFAPSESFPQLGSPIPLTPRRTSLSFPNRIALAEDLASEPRSRLRDREQQLQNPCPEPPRSVPNTGSDKKAIKNPKTPAFGSTGPEKLSAKLAHVDDRLRDFRNRNQGSGRKNDDSPF